MRWLVLLGLLAAACDGAQDGTYRGERELALRTTLRFVGDGPPAFRVALVWGTADGRDVARVDPVASVCNVGAECLVELYSRPPAAALVAVRRGQLALGEVVAFDDRDGDARWGRDEPVLGRVALVVASPEGASDARFHETIPPGLHAVDALAPCSVAAAEQRFTLVPDTELSTAVITRDGGEPLYFDADCGARLAATAWPSCPRLDQTRWLCRAEDPDLALCARCEYQVFPPNAGAQACSEWRGRWTTHLLDPSLQKTTAEVVSEVRLCLADPPPVSDPCDHACACDKRYAYCRDVEQRPLLDCERERDGCLVF